MSKPTHVYIMGDAHTPERFWKRIFGTKEELESAGLNTTNGFIREITDNDKTYLNQKPNKHVGK